jgi:hypothetical protein
LGKLGDLESGLSGVEWELEAILGLISEVDEAGRLLKRL